MAVGFCTVIGNFVLVAMQLHAVIMSSALVAVGNALSLGISYLWSYSSTLSL